MAQTAAQKAAAAGKKAAKKRRNRQTAAYNADPLNDPTTVLSGAALRRAAQEVVKVQFDPQRAALGQELSQVNRQTDAQVERAGDYYRNLARDEAKSVARQQAVGALAGQAVNTLGARADDSLARAGQTAIAQADPGQTGATSRVAEEMAAARMRSAGDTQNAALSTNASAANYAGLAGIASQATAMRGGEIRGQLLNQLSAKQADIRSRKSALEAQVGPATTDTLLKLRQSGFDNLVTQQGLQIKTEDLRAQIAQNTAAQALANRRQTEVERNNARRAALENRRLNQSYNLGRARINATVRGQDLSYRSATLRNQTATQIAAANRSSRERIAAAQVAAKRAGLNRGRGMNAAAQKQLVTISAIETDIRNDGEMQRRARAGRWMGGNSVYARARNNGAGPLEALAAVEIVQFGRVSAETQRKLRANGVVVPPQWRPIGGRHRRPGPSRRQTGTPGRLGG